MKITQVLVIITQILILVSGILICYDFAVKKIQPSNFAIYSIIVCIYFVVVYKEKE